MQTILNELLFLHVFPPYFTNCLYSFLPLSQRSWLRGSDWLKKGASRALFSKLPQARCCRQRQGCRSQADGEAPKGGTLVMQNNKTSRAWMIYLNFILRTKKQQYMVSSRPLMWCQILLKSNHPDWTCLLLVKWSQINWKLKIELDNTGNDKSLCDPTTTWKPQKTQMRLTRWRFSF